MAAKCYYCELCLRESPQSGVHKGKKSVERRSVPLCWACNDRWPFVDHPTSADAKVNSWIIQHGVGPL